MFPRTDQDWEHSNACYCFLPGEATRVSVMSRFSPDSHIPAVTVLSVELTRRRVKNYHLDYIIIMVMVH